MSEVKPRNVLIRARNILEQLWTEANEHGDCMLIAGQQSVISECTTLYWLKIFHERRKQRYIMLTKSQLLELEESIDKYAAKKVAEKLVR